MKQQTNRARLESYPADADGGMDESAPDTAAPEAGGEDDFALAAEKKPVFWLVGAAYAASRYLPLLGFFAIWEWISRSDPSLARLLPAPTQVIDGAIQLIQRGELQQDILASLKRVAVALVFACGIGFPLGAALGASRTFLWLFEPIVNFFRPIPPLAWIPLSIVWLGIGDAQNEFIIFLGAFFPIVLNTMQGVRDVDKQLIRAAQTLGASRAAIIGTVILPGALSSMFIGFRVGLGIAWMALVAGELVAATSGLGFLISEGRLLFRSDYIVVGMVMIGIIGLMLDGAIRILQRIVMPWRQT
jgi:sulfonate transport system permease protein